MLAHPDKLNSSSKEIAMLRLLNAAYTLLRRRGLSYFGYLISGVFIPKIVYRLIYLVDSSRIRTILRIAGGSLAVLITVLLVNSIGWQFSLGIVSGAHLFIFLSLRFMQRYEIYHLYRKARDLTRGQQGRVKACQFTAWSDLQVMPDTRRAIEAAWRVCSQDELLLGPIDQDGRVLGVYGAILGMDMVSPEDFLPRNRYKLEIVLSDGYVLLRKDFGRNRAGFVREWYHLLVLAGNANVPAIYKVDEANLQIYMNFIPGRTVRDILVEAGAKIRNVQIASDPELAPLDPAARAFRVIERGRALVPGLLSDVFLAQLEQQLEQLHRCKLASLDIKYGNIIIHPEDGSPWLVDFENARRYTDVTHLVFLYKRDKDRKKFNLLFHRNLLTEASARDRLNEQGKQMPWYAPLDFGNGLTVGPFWSTDSGTGRWEYLNQRVLAPLVKGKRILDLGSNNGTMPMMMLRSGAEEVVGLELSPIEMERAEFVRQVFEWRDMRTYHLNLYNLNVLQVLHHDWGRFDLVTAFCSLYYLEAEQMAQVTRRVAELAPLMIVQANTSSQQDPQKHRKASVSFLKKLLQENGFAQVEIFAPQNFTRPILIGRQIPNP